jgi:CRP-like cAMP-binding protein
MKETPFLEGRSAVLETLKRVSFFSNLEERHLQQVFRMSKMRQYDPDELIIPEGVYDSIIYVLLSGEVAIVKGGDPIARLHKTGDIFGELAIINCEPRSASVFAVSRTTCLAVDAAFLDNLVPLDRDPVYAVVYKLFAEIIAQRLRVTSGELAAVREELARVKMERVTR